MKLSIAAIADLLGGKLIGTPDTEIHDICKIQEGKPGAITFLANPKYEPYIYETQASAVLVNADFIPKQEIKACLIQVEDAYLAFTRLLGEYEKMQIKSKKGIESPSFVAQTASLGSGCYVGAFAYIGENVEIGDNVKIYPQVYVGDNCKIADNSVIYAGAKLYARTIIGKDCMIHSGAVIGSDGFGFAPKADGSYENIPQIGNVVIQDNVSIGANTTIDCATIGSTLIASGVKIDNLVQIAHNVKVGEHTVIVSHAGIAGSAEIGKYCVIAGQVGIAGHTKIADKITIGAQSGVTKSFLKPNQNLLGSPAQDHRDMAKVYVLQRQLPNIEKRLRTIEKHLKDVE
ncbi:MAG: UDP-3-O-(3-hydroxymyristoyl)glucosamine N-acyltransferase [Bernardetiaceae bacterium]|nr:UDP-3-O-(3-hydroxymyristoyl)glucosamine N-acyltransferase [Bernardetiaceae bacterium]